MELGVGRAGVRAQQWGVGASGASLGWKSITHYLGVSPSLGLASMGAMLYMEENLKTQ